LTVLETNSLIGPSFIIVHYDLRRGILITFISNFVTFIAITSIFDEQNKVQN